MTPTKRKSPSNSKVRSKSQEQTATETSKNLFPLIPPLLFFVFALAWVGTLDLPIYDDWTYSWAVNQLAQTGQIKYLAGFAPNYPAIIAAALISIPFGISFAALHSISALFAALAYIGLYLSVLELSKKPWLSAIAASVFLFNPIMINLCFAFMSDIPFLAFSTWGLFFIAKALNTNTHPGTFYYCLSASACIALATATRQIGLAFLPALFCFQYFQSRRLSRLQSILHGAILFLPTFLIAIVTRLHLSTAFLYPQDYQRIELASKTTLEQWASNPLSLIYSVFHFTPEIFAYLGLFCAPIIFAAIISRLHFKLSRIAVVSALIAVAIPLAWEALFRNNWMPFYPQLLYSLLPGQYAQVGAKALSSFEQMQGLTIVSVLLGSYCAAIFLEQIPAMQANETKQQRDWQSNRRILICTLAVVAALIPLALLQGVVMPADRYLLALLPATLIIASSFVSAANPGKLFKYSALVGCLALALYSATGARDWSEYVQARWDCIEQLESQGKTALDFDGGPEYIYSTCPAIYANANPPTQPRSWSGEICGAEGRQLTRWWPVLSENYVVNPYALPGYTAIYEKPFQSRLRGTMEKMLVLKKISEDNAI